MKPIMISISFSEAFAKSFIPNLYVSLLKEELRKSNNNDMMQKAVAKFGITKKDIINLINIKNITISQVNDFYAVRFNNNRIGKIFLEPLLDFINDGDLSNKGSNIFHNTILYINNHIRTIYYYYLMKGE